MPLQIKLVASEPEKTQRRVKTLSGGLAMGTVALDGGGRAYCFWNSGSEGTSVTVCRNEFVLLSEVPSYLDQFLGAQSPRPLRDLMQHLGLSNPQKIMGEVCAGLHDNGVSVEYTSDRSKLFAALLAGRGRCIMPTVSYVLEDYGLRAHLSIRVGPTTTRYLDGDDDFDFVIIAVCVKSEMAGCFFFPRSCVKR